MTQQQLLQSILDKTFHIRGGLDAEDMDIVANALDEREELIAAYAKGNFGRGSLSGECAKIAENINKLDSENNNLLKELMDGCNEKVFEARRELKKLQTGKKAANQYYGGAGSGGVFDFKK